MEFAIAFIDSDGSEKSASIKAISEHKAVELFAHIYFLSRLCGGE